MPKVPCEGLADQSGSISTASDAAVGKELNDDGHCYLRRDYQLGCVTEVCPVSDLPGRLNFEVAKPEAP